jgi:hypothetical protein
MLIGEDLVHRLGADGDNQPDLVAIDRLGDGRRTVAHEAADFLDSYPVVRQQRDEVWRTSRGVHSSARPAPPSGAVLESAGTSSSWCPRGHVPSARRRHVEVPAAGLPGHPPGRRDPTAVHAPPRSGRLRGGSRRRGVQAVRSGRLDQGHGLPERERLRRTAFLTNGVYPQAW